MMNSYRFIKEIILMLLVFFATVNSFAIDSCKSVFISPNNESTSQMQATASFKERFKQIVSKFNFSKENEKIPNRFPFQDANALEWPNDYSMAAIRKYKHEMTKGSLAVGLKRLKKRLAENKNSDSYAVEKYAFVFEAFEQTLSIVKRLEKTREFQQSEVISLAIKMAQLVTLLNKGSEANDMLMSGHPKIAQNLVSSENEKGDFLSKFQNYEFNFLNLMVNYKKAPLVILTTEEPSLSNLILANMGGFVFLTVKFENGLVFDRFPVGTNRNSYKLTSLFHLIHDYSHLESRIQSDASLPYKDKNGFLNEESWRNEIWYNEAVTVLDRIKQSPVPENVKLAARWILAYHLFEDAPYRWDLLKNLIKQRDNQDVNLYKSSVDPREFIDRMPLFNLVRGVSPEATASRRDIESLQDEINTTFVQSLQLLKKLFSDL
ncbi:MAG: hypothetical protein ACXWRZ_05940 [Bdellovibrio sp.]